MNLTIEQMNVVHKLIIRFLKENDLYKYRRKDIKVIKYDYLSDSHFIDTTIANFSRRYMNHYLSLNEQFIFVTEYITKITEKTTEELFLQFLTDNNISFNKLLKLLNKYKDVMSDREYLNRLNIINNYKPHIMSALQYCYYNMEITSKINLPTLTKKWRTFYSENVKFI